MQHRCHGKIFEKRVSKSQHCYKEIHLTAECQWLGGGNPGEEPLRIVFFFFSVIQAGRDK